MDTHLWDCLLCQPVQHYRSEAEKTLHDELWHGRRPELQLPDPPSSGSSATVAPEHDAVRVVRSRKWARELDSPEPAARPSSSVDHGRDDGPSSVKTSKSTAGWTSRQSSVGSSADARPAEAARGGTPSTALVPSPTWTCDACPVSQQYRQFPSHQALSQHYHDKHRIAWRATPDDAYFRPPTGPPTGDPALSVSLCFGEHVRAVLSPRSVVCLRCPGERVFVSDFALRDHEAYKHKELHEWVASDGRRLIIHKHRGTGHFFCCLCRDYGDLNVLLVQRHMNKCAARPHDGWQPVKARPTLYALPIRTLGSPLATTTRGQKMAWDVEWTRPDQEERKTAMPPPWSRESPERRASTASSSSSTAHVGEARQIGSASSVWTLHAPATATSKPPSTSTRSSSAYARATGSSSISPDGPPYKLALPAALSSAQVDRSLSLDPSADLTSFMHVPHDPVPTGNVNIAPDAPGVPVVQRLRHAVPDAMPKASGGFDFSPALSTEMVVNADDVVGEKKGYVGRLLGTLRGFLPGALAERQAAAVSSEASVGPLCEAEDVSEDDVESVLHDVGHMMEDEDGGAAAVRAGGDVA